jgi:integrase
MSVPSIYRTDPKPYHRGELSKLWDTIDERWPKVDEDEAWFWLQRWLDGVSPYSRVRAQLIRRQLDAIVALALHCGLRRKEIYRLDLEAMHDDNAHIVVWGKSGAWAGDDFRTVPHTGSGRALTAPWCRMRSALAPGRSRAWLNLHAEPTAREPMSDDTFNKVLRTYVGEGWTLARLRATCGVAWAKTGLLPEHMRKALGYASIEDVLPYLALVGGDVEKQMARRDRAFSALVDAGA